MEKRLLEGSFGTYRLGALVERTAWCNVYRVHRRGAPHGSPALCATQSTLQFDDATERRERVDSFSEHLRHCLALRHPRLASAVDFVADHHCHYTIYTHAAGVRLSLLLDRHHIPSSEKLLLRLAADLVVGLKVLHEQPVPLYVGDFSPTSVVVSRAGRAVIADLGLGRHFHVARSEEPGAGVPGYAAPEQWAEKFDLDARTDLYALGAILWHVVTLREPHSAGFPLPPLREVQPATSPALEAFVVRCTQLDPVLRYPSAQAALAALVAIEPALVERSRWARFFHPMTRFMRRREPLGA